MCLLVLTWSLGVAMNLIFANYGKWFVQVSKSTCSMHNFVHGIQDYNLDAAALGAITIAIGVGEILAEV